MVNVPARAPSVNIIRCPRIHQGRPVVKELAFTYQDTGETLPQLTILSDWSVRADAFRDIAHYAVEEVPAGVDGRTFLLHRSPEDIGADREAGVDDPDVRYGVFVSRNGQDDLCE